MRIFCVSGFCPCSEDGSIHIVNNVFSSLEQAEEALSDEMEITREYAQLAESVKGLCNGNGTWTETTENIHGSEYAIKRYSCQISADLKDEGALELLRKMSAIGLLDDFSGTSIADGITIPHFFSALPFKIASLTISSKEL